MARVLAFDDSSSASGGDGATSLPPPAQQPPAADNRAGATSRPLKRVARFLGDDGSDEDDNDDNNGGYSAAAYGSANNSRRDLAGLAAQKKKKKTTAQDVDRMFADLDEDDDDHLSVPLAQRRNNDDAPQNSMINDTITGFGGDDGDAPNDKIDAEKAKKMKRKPVLMNEERLLGDKGIRRLKENLKGFKIKGKGHEVGF